MRILRLWPVLAVCLLAGCEDVIETVKEPLQVGVPPPSQTEQTFAADPRKTFAAAKGALAQMGFRFTHGGPAEGVMEAISDVAPGEIPGSSHQYLLKARFNGTLDGNGTVVSLEMTEVVEDDSLHRPGQGTESAMRDASLYQAFFRYIQQQLSAQP